MSITVAILKSERAGGHEPWDPSSEGIYSVILAVAAVISFLSFYSRSRLPSHIGNRGKSIFNAYRELLLGRADLSKRSRKPGDVQRSSNTRGPNISFFNRPHPSTIFGSIPYIPSHSESVYPDPA